MILIGQYDSPFFRRVDIALKLYDLPFRQEPWSVFGDADRIRPFNPLTRVPTLVLAEGDSLIDSHLILDCLDGLVPPDRRLFPQSEPDRRRALHRAGLATGIGDKAVSLFYEQRLHTESSDLFVQRCKRQIAEGWQVLEDHYAHAGLPARPGHDAIALACVWRFVNEAHPGLTQTTSLPALPALSALAAQMEATAAFQAISQPFIAPA
ncbi:MAG: glutathione S-transferase N-terminal domain-containing protein [Rhodobacteraceae bacterium]|nr:glutathione S-transferase N-terminal domain-containing protein [Paracoccaceae bacterium]